MLDMNKTAKIIGFCILSALIASFVLFLYFGFSNDFGIYNCEKGCDHSNPFLKKTLYILKNLKWYFFIIVSPPFIALVLGHAALVAFFVNKYVLKDQNTSKK